MGFELIDYLLNFSKKICLAVNREILNGRFLGHVGLIFRYLDLDGAMVLKILLRGTSEVQKSLVKTLREQ